MRFKKIGFGVFLFPLLLGCATTHKQKSVAGNEKKEIIRMVRLVNDHWQDSHSPDQPASWDWAAYQTGNMEAYKLTKDSRYLKYAEDWSVHNQWMGAKSADKKEWKYHYGETEQYVLFGDWQTCFQTYIDLYQLDPQPFRIARAKEVMEYQMSTPYTDYWWWIDGLYMVMPVMTKLYKVTGEALYLSKLHAYFAYTDSLLYDKESKLYYRDAKYIYPGHQTNSGRKDFWSRGNGWAFAAFAKVLEDLPEDDPWRGLYLNRFRGMAEELRKTQQPQGYWSRSLLDEPFAPGPETSGTAFFVYGLLWGINRGYLSRADYETTAKKGWDYLKNTALQEDGTIGFVQPIGEKAIPGQKIDKSSTTNFGVGAFLLAASERYKFLEQKIGN